MDWRVLHNGLEGLHTGLESFPQGSEEFSTMDWRVSHKALEHCILQPHIDMEASPH